MAGINFITRIDDENITEPDHEFPERGKWEITLPSGDTIEVTELQHQFRVSGVPQSGGYVGCSFRPGIGVLSIGTPAFALSPNLVKWGLKRVMEWNNWFIRVDPEGLEEVEDQERFELYEKALDLDADNYIGIEPAGGELIRRVGSPEPQRSINVQRAIEIAASVWKSVTLTCRNDFLPENGKEKVVKAAMKGLYARPVHGRENIEAVAEDVANRIAQEYRRKAARIRQWRRDSDRLEEIEEELEAAENQVQEMENEVCELEEEVKALRRKNTELERKLSSASYSESKIGVIKALKETLGVDIQRAKDAVESIT